MELQLVLFVQVVVGLILCLPTLIASTARPTLGGACERAARPRAVMGRSKYAFYTP